MTSQAIYETAFSSHSIPGLQVLEFSPSCTATFKGMYTEGLIFNEVHNYVSMVLLLGYQIIQTGNIRLNPVSFGFVMHYRLAFYIFLLYQMHTF